MITQCLSLMTDIGMDDDDAAEWNASDDVSGAKAKSCSITTRIHI
jgi:hypothetical protein